VERNFASLILGIELPGTYYARYFVWLKEKREVKVFKE
jgi:hypothetical protein